MNQISPMSYCGYTQRYLFNDTNGIRKERLIIAVSVKHFFNGNPSRLQDGIRYKAYLEFARLVAEQSNQIDFYNRAMFWFGSGN